MDTINLKYLKDVPWLDLAGDRWVMRFERKMDKWMKKLVPIYEIAKERDLHYVNFGHDGSKEGCQRDYIWQPEEGNDDYFTQDGISFVICYSQCPECGDTIPSFLGVNSIKDSEKLSWRNFICHDEKKYYEAIGNVLLIPYFDPRINTSPLYSSVIDNISMEFGKLTEDPKVKILFQSSGMYSMTL